MAWEKMACPHCTIGTASDGHCHNNPETEKYLSNGAWQDSGINMSCVPCRNAASTRGEVVETDWLTKMFGKSHAVPGVVLCHVCLGMKFVMFDAETMEIRQIKLETKSGS